MRRFNSYGPVDCEVHFCVQRKDLGNQCVEQLGEAPAMQKLAKSMLAKGMTPKQISAVTGLETDMIFAISEK